MYMACQILRHYGFREWRMDNRGLIDVTSWSDQHIRYHDNGARELTMVQHIPIKALKALWSHIMPLESQRSYNVARNWGIGYYQKHINLTRDGAERVIVLSYNTNAMRLFIGAGIAHFIDPRVPWFERRLTYRRRKGWQFPHRPYCNIERERRRERERLAEDQEGYGDYDDYWDYPEGDDDD